MIRTNILYITYIVPLKNYAKIGIFNCDLIKVQGGLKCTSCGNFEERKVSIDYGKESFTLLYDKQYFTK